MGEKKKKIVFKFTEKELSMYNTTLMAALHMVYIRRLKDSNVPKEIIEYLMEPDYVRNQFQEDLDRESDRISEGNFSLELFKYEEEDE